MRVHRDPAVVVGKNPPNPALRRLDDRDAGRQRVEQFVRRHGVEDRDRLEHQDHRGGGAQPAGEHLLRNRRHEVDLVEARVGSLVLKRSALPSVADEVDVNVGPRPGLQVAGGPEDLAAVVGPPQGAGVHEVRGLAGQRGGAGARVSEKPDVRSVRYHRHAAQPVPFPEPLRHRVGQGDDGVRAAVADRFATAQTGQREAVRDDAHLLQPVGEEVAHLHDGSPPPHPARHECGGADRDRPAGNQRDVVRPPRRVPRCERTQRQRGDDAPDEAILVREADVQRAHRDAVNFAGPCQAAGTEVRSVVNSRDDGDLVPLSDPSARQVVRTRAPGAVRGRKVRVDVENVRVKTRLGAGIVGARRTVPGERSLQRAATGSQAIIGQRSRFPIARVHR